MRNLDWKLKEKLAKKLSVKELQGALEDCLVSARSGVDTGYYYDEASVYKKELEKRGVKTGLRPEWCKCGKDEFHSYPEDGQCRCGIHKHHVHCLCGGVLQVG